MTFDGSKFFEKKNGEWRYYPLGSVVDYYFVVKSGCKDDFQKSLNKEWSIVLSVMPLIVASGIWGRFWLAVVFVFLFVVFFIFNRNRNRKLYCLPSTSSKQSFIKNYFVVVYHFLDEDDDKYRFDLIMFGSFTILLGLWSWYYKGSTVKAWAIICFLVLGVGSWLLFIMASIKRRRKNLKD